MRGTNSYSFSVLVKSQRCGGVGLLAFHDKALIYIFIHGLGSVITHRCYVYVCVCVTIITCQRKGHLLH